MKTDVLSNVQFVRGMWAYVGLFPYWKSKYIFEMDTLTKFQKNYVLLCPEEQSLCHFVHIYFVHLTQISCPLCNVFFYVSKDISNMCVLYIVHNIQWGLVTLSQLGGHTACP